MLGHHYLSNSIICDSRPLILLVSRWVHIQLRDLTDNSALWRGIAKFGLLDEGS